MFCISVYFLFTYVVLIDPNDYIAFHLVIDCPTGFYGTNCSRPCRYPNYGTNCQQDCSHCERLQCNATFGCLTTSTDAPFNQGTFNLYRKQCINV